MEGGTGGKGEVKVFKPHMKSFGLTHEDAQGKDDIQNQWASG